jgi:hypothetical protein
MINGNHFQFDRKKTSLIFEKRFMVLKTVNRFVNLKSLFFQARLWESAVVDIGVC